MRQLRSRGLRSRGRRWWKRKNDGYRSRRRLLRSQQNLLYNHMCAGRKCQVRRNQNKTVLVVCSGTRANKNYRNPSCRLTMEKSRTTKGTSKLTTTVKTITFQNRESASKSVKCNMSRLCHREEQSKASFWEFPQ